MTLGLHGRQPRDLRLLGITVTATPPDPALEQDPVGGARFARLFPGLGARPDVPPGPGELGAPGGLLDGGASIRDSAQENPAIPAGYVFLGQFIVHDVTFDPTSISEQLRDPSSRSSFRTPALDLDSVYGGGPRISPYLYDRSNPAKFILAPDGGQRTARDLPRNAQGVALIADPRNDETIVLSQLHFAFLKLHNRLVEDLSTSGVPSAEVFERARGLVRRHYQAIVLREYLPLVCGHPVLDDVVLNGRKFYRFEGKPFVPFELSAAVFRFGHSQVAPWYRVNSDFAAPLFSASPAADDIRGGRNIGRDMRPDWRLFFAIDAAVAPQPSRRIDTKISSPLFRLPESVASAEGNPLSQSLPARTLQRGLSVGLPSGQDVAQHMKLAEKPLDDAEIWPQHRDEHRSLARFRGQPAPLWYYVLREAEVRRDGKALGPAGSRILAEFFVGLLEWDVDSVFAVARAAWGPFQRGDRRYFGIADLLRHAGVA